MNRGSFFSSTYFLLGVLLIVNIVVWVWALSAFGDNTSLMGMAVLAYSFGMRHAVDADHIVAIDSVTRKFMQQGKRSVSVGTFFSLGHSTIVILASLAISFSVINFSGSLFSSFKQTGSIIGTTISSLFLLIFSFINLSIFLSTKKKFRQLKDGHLTSWEGGELSIKNGIMTRVFGRLFHFVNKNHHMYFVGFLFGLGFDTATEIGVLGITAMTSSHNMSLLNIMVFPALFTSAMVLIDTLDNYLMVGAYGWAFHRPQRKLYYNMTVTGMSVIIAFFIGSVEILNLITEKLNISGGIWDTVDSLSDNIADMGFLIIGLFVACWLCSVTYYWIRGYDKLSYNHLSS